MSKLEPRLGGVQVQPDQADGQAEEQRDEAAQLRRAEHRGGQHQRQHHDREVRRRPDVDGDVGQRRGEERHQQGADGAGDEGADRRGGEGLGGATLPGHLVALDGGHHRRGLTGGVQQDRRRRAAVHAAVVDAGEHDERLRGLHAVGHRQQQRDRHRRADAGEDADEGAEQHADGGVHQVHRGEGGLEAVREQVEGLHQSTPSSTPGVSGMPRPT